MGVDGAGCSVGIGDDESDVDLYCDVAVVEAECPEYLCLALSQIVGIELCISFPLDQFGMTLSRYLLGNAKLEGSTACEMGGRRSIVGGQRVSSLHCPAWCVHYLTGCGGGCAAETAW